MEYVTIAETATNKKTDLNSTDRQKLSDIDLKNLRRKGDLRRGETRANRYGRRYSLGKTPGMEKSIRL